MPSASIAAKRQAFHRLHDTGCFLIPNPWDIGSAVYLRRLNFKALATTSAGFAFTRGLPDDPRAIDRDVMLTHIREIVGATPLPVNAASRFERDETALQNSSRR